MEKDILKNKISEIANLFWCKRYAEEIVFYKKNFNLLKEAGKSKPKGKFIRPYLNKNKIRNISRKFKINNETLEKIISTIKPPPWN